MKIEKIQNYITPKSTGYASAIALGAAALTGVSKNKSIKKAHKPLAWLTAGLTVLHIALIEYYHHKYRGK